MNYNKKSKEELIAELEELNQKYNSLTEKFNKDISLHKLTDDVYRNMIDNSPRGMHFYNLNGNYELIFSAANKAANKILKIDNSQFIGKTISNARRLPS